VAFGRVPARTATDTTDYWSYLSWEIMRGPIYRSPAQLAFRPRPGDRAADDYDDDNHVTYYTE